MQIFVQVVEKGSFTAAAEQLHRPIATRAIQGLEQGLGVPLLSRTTRVEGLVACSCMRGLLPSVPRAAVMSACRPQGLRRSPRP
ncbi:LysR family transcriptional regulator [Vogesella sp. LIG4]|uniref:helix-turn-helix domain-containing protein n=1 Tax=Vogesella sp. LIG4 TaxID=1192162 RepID=UPI00350EEB11